MNKKTSIDLSKKYKYIGQPLQKEEFYEIILNYSSYIPCLKSGKAFQTNQLLNEILEFHIVNGGTKDYYRVGIHKAINKLQVTHQELLEKTKRGWYVYNNKIKKRIKIVTAKPTILKKPDPQPIAKKTYREGKYYIYVLFDGNNTCKIGKTKNTASRFKTYASGWSVMWEYIIEVRLENESVMNMYEITIHNILKIRNLVIKHKNKGGNEFFTIKPEEIKKVIETVNKLVF